MVVARSLTALSPSLSSSYYTPLQFDDINIAEPEKSNLHCGSGMFTVATMPFAELPVDPMKHRRPRVSDVVGSRDARQTSLTSAISHIGGRRPPISVRTSSVQCCICALQLSDLFPLDVPAAD